MTDTVVTSPLDLRPLKATSIPMQALRADMARLAASAADTYMTYALVGHPSPSPWSALEAQAKVIAGEYEELQKAVKDRDVKELRDGIGDLLYTVFGMAYRAGIPMNADFEQVVRSNLTKFDISATDATVTKNKYEALGVKTYCQPVSFTSGERGDTTYYITFVNGDQVGTDGKTYPDHKWLKSIKFVDIFLTPLAPSHPLQQTSHAIVADSFHQAMNILDNQDDPALYHTLLMTIAGLYLLHLKPEFTAEDCQSALGRAHFALTALFESQGLDVLDGGHSGLSQFDAVDVASWHYLMATLHHVKPRGASRFLKHMEADLRSIGEPDGQSDAVAFLTHLRSCGAAIDDNAALREQLSQAIMTGFGESLESAARGDVELFISRLLNFLTESQADASHGI